MRNLDPAETEFCDRLLNEVSRTFALSIRSLPAELGDAVRAAYLLCRIVDTVEDDRAVSSERRAALFDAFDAALRAASAGDPGPSRGFEVEAAGAALGHGAERELCGSAGVVFRAFSILPASQREAIAPRLSEMSSGMREYSRRADTDGGLRIHDVADLERYCHYVAGTVGELLTDLFALACAVPNAVRAELDLRAARFGLGLQLVNILKDVAEDAERGDCFLPIASAAEHDVDLERLFEPDQRGRVLALCRHLSRRAREHLEAAEEYTLAWPNAGRGRDARAFCAGPLALALGTLRLVELGPDTAVRGRAPTVSKSFVFGTLADIDRALRLPDPSASNAALGAVFDRARVGIAGRPSRPPLPGIAPAAVRFPNPRTSGASVLSMGQP